MVSTVIIPLGSADAALVVNWAPDENSIAISSVLMEGEPMPHTFIDVLCDDITDEIEKQLDAKNLEAAA